MDFFVFFLQIGHFCHVFFLILHSNLSPFKNKNIKHMFSYVRFSSQNILENQLLDWRLSSVAKFFRGKKKEKKENFFSLHSFPGQVYYTRKCISKRLFQKVQTRMISKCLS